MGYNSLTQRPHARLHGVNLENAMPQTLTAIIEPPSLDHDAMMERRFGSKVSPRGRLERRIVANLIAHLEANGFQVTGLYDGEELEPCSDMKSAMELIFNLDEAWLRVRKAECDGDREIFLVLGNGIDTISDWTYLASDPDGFNAAMNAFDADRLA